MPIAFRFQLGRLLFCPICLPYFVLYFCLWLAPAPSRGVMASAPSSLAGRRGKDQVVQEAAALIKKYRVGATKTRLVPDMVIVDPQNRDGQFPRPDPALHNAESICSAGFVLAEARAVCIQLPSDDEAKQAIIDFNKNTANDDPRLPKVAALSFELARVSVAARARATATSAHFARAPADSRTSV
jgi:hypothetical protein